MPMPDFTPPTYVAPATPIDSEKHNTEVVDNISFLHYAKAGTFGRSSNLVVPSGSFTSLAWDFATLETVEMWSPSPHPERITPSVGGLWLFTVRIQWPPSAGGARSVRMQQQGVTPIGQDTRLASSSYTLYSTFSAIALLDGIGQFVNFHAWQDSGSDVTLTGGHRLDAVYLGAA